MSSVANLPNHMFTGQALSSKQLTSIVHILSPETDNCPSWISGRERMTIENISRSISANEYCRSRWGSNPQPSGLQLDAHPNEPSRPTIYPWKFSKNPTTDSYDVVQTRKCDADAKRDPHISSYIIIIWFLINEQVQGQHPHSVKKSILSSYDLDVQWTKTIWTTLKEDQPRIIPVKFGQTPKSSLGDVIWRNCLQTHGQRQAWTKCDHKTSPCHYVRGELKIEPLSWPQWQGSGKN